VRSRGVNSVSSLRSKTSRTTRKTKPTRKRVRAPSSTLFSNDRRAESASAEESNAESDIPVDSPSQKELSEDDQDDDVIRTDRTETVSSDDDAKGEPDDEDLAKADWNTELGMANSELKALQYGTRPKRGRHN
jgi:hypothetical protein